MSSNVKDIISGSVLLVLSISMYIASLGIRKILPFGVSSAFFPKVVALFLAVISILIIAQGVRSYRQEKGTIFKLSDKKVGGVVLATLLLLGFYVFSLEFLGFVLTTFVYLVLQIGVLAPPRQRNWTVVAIISAVVSLGAYYSFYHLFHLILPTGFWG